MFIVESPGPLGLTRYKNSSESWCSLVSSRELHGITGAFELESDASYLGSFRVLGFWQSIFVKLLQVLVPRSPLPFLKRRPLFIEEKRD
ncbi:hypothetical protein CDL15_Pgr015949 [Punica granatum]|uniref:Uncharacterized protein n=1 Tax=Punica granatum TaxID=22663 RepID=A0A218XPM5_PUNGR|nr:hypothetical protein CDL15_Pgr015949 [Punica granatum]PKI38420.1 hypothetical protein CRG98_041200 [Punica granatum]